MFKNHPVTTAVIAVVTIVMWVLMMKGWLPEYDTSEIEEHIQSIFPIWIFGLLFLASYIYSKSRSIKNAEPEEEKKEKQE